MQFFRYLYHNVPDLSPMWHSPEFLCALAAAVFPFNIRPYSEMVRFNLSSICCPALSLIHTVILSLPGKKQTKKTFDC